MSTNELSFSFAVEYEKAKRRFSGGEVEKVSAVA
jgi:hypothetical protein